MDELLSTKEMAWVIGRSSGTVRDMIRDGDIEVVRLPAGYRIPKAEALRVAREHVEAETGESIADRRLEALIDQVIDRNVRATAP